MWLRRRDRLRDEIVAPNGQGGGGHDGAGAVDFHAGSAATPPNLGCGKPENKYFIFGKDGGKRLAEKHQVNFLGEIPLVQSIREAGDTGIPAILQNDVTSESFNDIAKKLAQQVAIRNAEISKTKKVELKI